ncbi:MAG: hypothetical protein V3S33_02805 [Gammaproteobacteria bacterium]
MNGPIIVLGMHRSGTSFLVRALNLLGLWLGAEDHMSTMEGRAAIGNLKGNYEHLGSVFINNAILANSGGAWNSPPRSLVVSPGDLSNMQRLAEYLEKGMPPGFTRWGWKDPRTVLTLDAWTKALGRDITLIATFRHPRAVAESLHARNGMPLELSYTLWAFYNQSLLKHLNQYPSVLVRFDVKKELLVEQVLKVCARVGLRAERDRILDWYDSGLVRNPTVLQDDSPYFEAVAPVWDALLAFHENQAVCATTELI